MKTKICVIADGYPYNSSNHCAFVRELVVELAKQGCLCTVIAPQMIMIGRKYLPYHWIDEVSSSIAVSVYAPKFISVSSKPYFMEITMHSHAQAVRNDY